MKQFAAAFEKVSSLITARDLQEPLALPTDRDANAFDEQVRLSEEGFSQRASISMVVDKGEPVGWWAWTEESVDPFGGATVDEIMEDLVPSMFVSATTRYIDLADKFAKGKGGIFFVIDGTEITGSLCYLDMLSRVGQLCLLALTFLLEATADQLCSLCPGPSWAAISEKRQNIAKEVYARRYGDKKNMAEWPEHQQLPYLVKSTTFVDKIPMLTKQELNGTMSKSEMRSLFSLAERVRNICAHGGDANELYHVLPSNKFSRFLNDTQHLIESLRLQISRLNVPHE